MVTHETYQAADGRWLSPEEVSREGDRLIERATGAPVSLGRVEKMSKSKKNTVDPAPIVARYGADAVRWFMLSDSPPERDLPWSDAGIEGAWRFVQRIWRLLEASRSTASCIVPSPALPPTSRTWRSTRRWPSSTSWSRRSRRPRPRPRAPPRAKRCSG
jgi:leucyl-tRNA synthetase